MQSKNLGIVLLLIGILLLSSVLNPGFASDQNIKSLIRWTSLFGFCSIGVAIVIMTGGIDLSIGSVIGLAGCLLFLFLDSRWVDTEQTAVVVSQGPSPRDSRLTQLRIEANDFKPDRDDRLVFTNRYGAPSQATVYVTEREGDAVLVTVREPNLGLDDGAEVRLSRFHHRPIFWVIAGVLACSVAIGLLHGLLITYGRLQPFVVTLCGLLIYRGLARVLTDDQPQGFGSTLESTKTLFAGDAFAFPLPATGYVARGQWGSVARDPASGQVLTGPDGGPIAIPFWQWIDLPIAGLFLAVVAVICYLLLNRTVWGRYLLALGNNEQAARYSGVPTKRVIISAYVLCSLLAGFTGILFAFDFNGVEPSQLGNVYEMYAIAAAVIGGCSLRGGTGSIFGVIVGTAVMRTLFLAIGALQIPNSYEFIVIGSALLIAVVTDEVLRVAGNRRRRAAA